MSTTTGYLMHAVVEEKENRTMEILVTSVSTNQLMSGKIIGDMAVGLTQLAVWAIFTILALIFAKSYIPALSEFKFSGEQIALITMVMVPAFIMICGLVAAVGATVTSHSEGTRS
jgi:ABC-2 type transport system permease protein